MYFVTTLKLVPMKNTSPSTIQVEVSQPTTNRKACNVGAFFVNDWVKKALSSKKDKTPTTHEGPSQHLEVHFAFSKSILKKR